MEKKIIRTKLKKNDLVMVVSGKYKGKSGKIKELDKSKNRVIVEGVNIQKKTIKKSQENPKGAIIEKEGFMDVSNVMFFDGKDVTRLGYRFENEKKIRYSKKNNKVID